VLEERYVCHTNWLIVLFVSNVVLFLTGLFGMVSKYLVIAPHVFGYISSLTRDNPYMPRASGGTLLDGADRARLLKDVMVIFGDVQTDKSVGHIALAAMDEMRSVGRLRAGRQYL
jgi:hypothetical protein